MSLARTALVTGARSGIGRAIAHELLESGWAVAGTSREPSALDNRIQPIEIDFSDLDALDQRLSGGLFSDTAFDAVVLCAGAGDFGALEQFSSARVRRLIDLNLTSQVLLLRALVPDLKRRGAGRIVLLGSEAALEGHRNGAVYCATKFALRGLAQALREECAPRGVPVTLVNPGMVRTPFFDNLDFAPGEADDNAIEAADVAAAVVHALNARDGTVVDEINLSPMKHVVRKAR